MAKILTLDEQKAALATLPGWTLSNGCLHCEFHFKNFVQAFSFMTSIALEAEKLNHHPDWSNSYTRVVIDLITHNVGGITLNDLALAKKIVECSKNFKCTTQTQISTN